MGNGQNWRQIAQEPGPNGWSLTGRGHITWCGLGECDVQSAAA
jgi:hypothetical protein